MCFLINRSPIQIYPAVRPGSCLGLVWPSSSQFLRRPGRGLATPRLVVATCSSSAERSSPRRRHPMAANKPGLSATTTWQETSASSHTRGMTTRSGGRGKLRPGSAAKAVIVCRRRWRWLGLANSAIVVRGRVDMVLLARPSPTPSSMGSRNIQPVKVAVRCKAAESRRRSATGSPPASHIARLPSPCGRGRWLIGQWSTSGTVASAVIEPRAGRLSP